jgi:hypothetical protein
LNTAQFPCCQAGIDTIRHNLLAVVGEDFDTGAIDEDVKLNWLHIAQSGRKAARKIFPE